MPSGSTSGSSCGTNPWRKRRGHNDARCKVIYTSTHGIHGAGIYANIGGILMVNVTIYSIHGSYGVWEFELGL